MPINFYTKLILCFVFSCIFNQTVVAQEQPKSTFWDFNRYTDKDFPRIYTSMGFLVYNSFTNGNPATGLQNLQAGIHIEHSNFGISFHYGSRNRMALEIPNDYIPSDGGWFSGNAKTYPFDMLNEKIFSFKRIFYTKFDRMRFTAQAGAGELSFKKATNFKFQNPSTGGWISSTRANYSNDVVKKSYFAWHFNIGADFPLTKVIGFNANIFATLSQKEVSYWGIATNMTLGYIRKGKK